MISYAPNFKVGDIITFCEEEFVVLKNFGYIGTVQENCKNGTIINCYWEFQGVKCILNPQGIDKRR